MYINTYGKEVIMARTLEKYNENWDFIRESKMWESISKKNFPIPFFSIIGLFAEDANYELRDCYVQHNRLFIKGYTNGKQNELMLRFNYGVDNNLVVARIEFVHQRKGKMTELYRILKRTQRKYHTGAIIIEAVQTEEMEAWCLKNGFVKMEHTNSCFIQMKK